MVFLRCILYRKVSKISKGNEKMHKKGYIGRKIRGNCSGNPPKGNLGKNLRDNRKSAVGGQNSRWKHIQEQSHPTLPLNWEK